MELNAIFFWQLVKLRSFGNLVGFSHGMMFYFVLNTSMLWRRSVASLDVDHSTDYCVVEKLRSEIDSSAMTSCGIQLVAGSSCAGWRTHEEDDTLQNSALAFHSFLNQNNLNIIEKYKYISTGKFLIRIPLLSISCLRT